MVRSINAYWRRMCYEDNYFPERKFKLFNSFYHSAYLFFFNRFISAVHIWFISCIINTHFFREHINPQLTCSQRQCLHSSVGRLPSHRYRQVTGSNAVEVLDFFQASLRNCINCVHCDDHFFIFTPSRLFSVAIMFAVRHLWKTYVTKHLDKWQPT